MTRLTNDIRNAIRDKLLAHRFDTIILDLVAQFACLTDNVYNATYSKEDQRLMKSLPKGWLSEVLYLRCATAQGYQLTYFFNGMNSSIKGIAHHFLEPVNARPIVHKHDSYGGIKITSPALNTIIETLNQDVDKHNSAYNNAYTQIDSSLAAFSNLNKLIEAWPEVKPFAKMFLTQPEKAALPTVTVTKLNELLDLPV